MKKRGKKEKLICFILAIFISMLISNAAAQHLTCSQVNTGGKTCVEVSECKVLSGSSQYFSLTQDVRSDDICFFMKGDNNILDLNQYTITFGDLNVPDILNYNFELGDGDVASNWNLGSSYNVKRASTKEMSMIDDYVLKFATGSTPQEITSEYITLPATSSTRTYEAYGIFRTAYLAKFTISAEDSSGNTVCTKTSNNLEPGPMIVCSFKTAGGQYRIRIKHEKRAEKTTDIGYVDYAGIKPAQDKGIALTTYCTANDPNFPDRCSSGSASNILIKNGYIKQGRGKGIHSQGIRSLGDIGAIEVANVEIEVSGPDTQNIKATTKSIHDSHFINYAVWVENRQDLANLPVTTGSSEIYNNVFDGGQGCVSPGSSSIIHDNIFRPKISVTNHYAVSLYGDSNVQIYNNKFEGVGPGILVSSNCKNNKVYNNVFNITPQICDPEYISGTSSSAVRVTDYYEGTTSNNEFFNNTIYSFADGNYIRQKLPGCTVGNFAFFTSTSGGNNKYYNNQIEIKGAGDIDNVKCAEGWGTGCPGGVYAIALWISSYNDIFENNYVKADLYNAWIANTYGRARNNILRSNTFVKGDSPYSGYHTMRMGWWQYNALNNIFIDTKLENGANIDDVYFTGDTAIKEFDIRWYLDVNVKDSGGNPVSGAVVRTYDKNNALAYEGTTNSQGFARAELKEYYVYKNKTLTAQKTVYTPHTITISKSGYNTFTQQTTMDSSKQLTIDLSSGSIKTCSELGGTCKDKQCSEYNSCSSLGGTCTIGYCCLGQCTESVPTPPPETCNDGKLNQDETDVDCGGSICPKCAEGKVCLINSDCQSNNCTSGICTEQIAATPTPTPSDGTGSGGGGGGSGTPKICNENWSCQWGPCQDLTKTWVCRDLSYCNTTKLKPTDEGKTTSCLVESKCIDNDKDGYGIGKDCLGEDIDDNNATLNLKPGTETAQEPKIKLTLRESLYYGVLFILLVAILIVIIVLVKKVVLLRKISV